jgi:WD40 repeat protein
MFRNRTCLCILCSALAAALAYLLLFQGQPAAWAQAPKAGPVSFINDIAPILKESCFGCHGAKNPKGKLDMTRYESLRKGGTKDDPIAPGKPDESLLVDVLKATDKQMMPPKEAGGPLAKDKLALIEKWIKEGAKLDADVAKDADLPRELRKRWKPPVPFASYPFPVMINALAFTPDSKKLVVGGHHELTVWDVATGKLEKRIATRCRRAMAMAFLPDGKLVVAGSRPGEEGDVRVYDINGGTPKMENGIAKLDGVNDPKVMLKQLLEADDEVLCLALSADGKKLAAGGCDRMVYVWDLSGGPAAAKLEQSFENHADWVTGVAFTPDAKFLLTSSRDKTAKVWNLTTKESALTFPDHQNTVYNVAVKPDGKVGFSVGEDKQLRSWNATGDQVKQIRAFGGHGLAVLKVLYHPKQPLLITCSQDMTVRTWNPDSGAAVKTMSGHTDHVFSIAVSPDGELIASGAYNGEVRLWKVADGSLVRTFNASPGATVAAPMPPK